MIGGDIGSIVSFLEANALLAYLVLFIFMVIEGETLLIISGALVHLSVLNIFAVLTIAFIGTMIGDVLWYLLGKFLKDKPFAGRILSYFETVINKLLPNFLERPTFSLIIAKYIYGTNHATLILSGVMNMAFKIFFKAEIIASLIWVFVFAGVGYVFGLGAIKVTERASVYLLMLLVLVGVIMLIQKGLARYYEKKTEEFRPKD